MSQSELYSALKEISISKFLSEHEMNLILQNGKYVEYEKSETIYSENERVECIFILIRGVVKITRNCPDGRQVLKSILHPRAILDDLSIAGQEIRTSNAVVMSPLVAIYKIDMSLIKNIISNNMPLALGLIQYMGKGLQYSEERLESFVINDARERIVEFLKLNAESFGQAVGFEMLLKHNFTQQDIANYTGTSRQTVTMVLNDLKKTNKILFKRQSILIRDIKALA
jgi:CRP/FNR family transcriptional regulator, cyclic AMP receptor protein